MKDSKEKRTKRKGKEKMQNELWIAFMIGWVAAIGFRMTGGFLWWLCIEWEKTKIKKLELEKIVYSAKCRLKELEKENNNVVEQIKEIDKKL